MTAEPGAPRSDADRLFEQALDVPPTERAEWLTNACAGNPALREQVEALLRADASATRFLEFDALRIAERVTVDRLQAHLPDRYRIERELGQGGMATVYLAHDLRHDRPVALKVLYPKPAVPLALERFQREIRFAAQLQHPHILSVHDSGEAAGLFWFTMPYIDGETLRQRLMREGALPAPEAVRIAREVARALDYAHRRGLIHRDIKPENILLSREGDPLVADFGIGRALSVGPVPGGKGAEEELTRTGEILGTPAYMSLEQADGQEVDGRSDIYSLGVVLYEMLAGERPFTGGSAYTILAQQLTETPRPLRERAETVSPALEEIVMRMLARDPAGRYATAGELAEALESEQRAGASRPTRPEPVQTGMVVAVLPFANLSADPATEYLSDGISEELMQALAEIEGLRVVGRTSAFAFKGKREDVRDIGGRLRADVIVDGSVRVEGGQVRISAQLVNASDGLQLWSGRYQRPAGDTFVLEDDIARTIAGVLRQRLSPGREAASAATPAPSPSARRDPVAHEAYLKGRYHWAKRTPEAIGSAILWFERAIARAPEDAAVHAALADAHVTLSIYGASPAHSAMVKAKAAAEQALGFDPRSAEAHAALGSVAALFDWDWRRAEEHFRLALELKPRYPTAHQWQAMHVLAPLGRLADARRALEQARELDPLSPAILSSLAVVSLFERDWDRAVRELLEVIDLEPGFSAGHYFLGQALLWRGESAEAESELARAASLAGHSVETIAGLAYAQGVSGHRARALAVLEELTRRAEHSYVSPGRIAQIHLGLGQRDQALARLGQAVEQRCTEVAWFGVHPMFDELRSEPAFLVLLDRADLARRRSGDAIIASAAAARPSSTAAGSGGALPAGGGPEAFMPRI